MEKQSHPVSTKDARHVSGKEDEINLFDLWQVLVKRWKLISVITLLSIMGAVIYLALANPVYKAIAAVAPPETKDVEVLNVPDISQISSADIFAKFVGNFKRNSMRQRFFEESPQFSSLRNCVPYIDEGKKKEAGFVFLGFEGSDAKILADAVNSYIFWVEKETIKNFVSGVEENIANRRKILESEIRVAQGFAVQRRKDRIALLEDQIAIASTAKILDRRNYSLVVSEESDLSSGPVQRPLYLRGVRELAAEKEGLEKRKNDDPFIEGLRDKQEKLAQLNAGLNQFLATREGAHALIVDQQAFPPRKPVKPQGMRVLTLSVVLGIIIGLLAAFMGNCQDREMCRNERSR